MVSSCSAVTKAYLSSAPGHAPQGDVPGQEDLVHRLGAVIQAAVARPILLAQCRSCRRRRW